MNITSKSGDSLGITTDIESLIVLAKVARKRAMEESDKEALLSWEAAVKDIAARSKTEGNVSPEWLSQQQRELEETRQKIM